MPTFRPAALTALIALAAACSKDMTTTGTITNPNLRFVNGIHAPVNVLVDGVAVISNVGLGAVGTAAVAAGSHVISIQATSGSAVGRTIQLGSSVATIVGTDSSGALRPSILDDTGAVVPAGHTKMRVANFASGAPAIDVWRTQPDYQTPIRVVFPFNYNFVSSYVQSTVGAWQIMVSHPVAQVNDPMPDTMATSGSVNVADGKSITAVVVDGATAGSVQVVVIQP